MLKEKCFGSPTVLKYRISGEGVDVVEEYMETFDDVVDLAKIILKQNNLQKVDIIRVEEEHILTISTNNDE